MFITEKSVNFVQYKVIQRRGDNHDSDKYNRVTQEPKEILELSQ